MLWLFIRGIGIWGINIPVAWGFDIINVVWWIGIGHAGTLISAVLLLLLALTVGVAFFDLGTLGVVVALGIAFAKAALIVLYFMHVRYSTRLVQVFAGVSMLWLVFMLTLTIADYVTRADDWPPTPEQIPLAEP